MCGTILPMRANASFDVLVVGSGAAGLAAGVAAERAGARVAVATKTTLQACNSAKAQGGIQAAFGEDDSPEIHAEDVMRSSHDTAEPEARRGAHERGAVGDPLARGVRRRVHAPGLCRLEWSRPFERRRLPARALRRRDAAPAAPGRRPNGSRDHEGAARGVRGRRRHRAPAPRASGTGSGRERLDRVLRHEGRARGCGGRQPSSSPPAVAASPRRRRSASSPRTIPTRPGEVTRIAMEAGAETRDLDALQYHPNGGAWPSTMQGYSIPETTRAYGAVLRNADGEEFTDSLGPRDAVCCRDRRGGREGQGRGDARRPSCGLARHDAHLARGRGDLAPVHASPVPGSGHRPPRRADLHLPRPPLPERWARDRRARGDDPRGRLRLRRDRGRHPRKEPHDGQLAARVRRVRPACRQGGGERSRS